MTTPTQLTTPSPEKSPLELENEALRARVIKLEEMVLAYRTERQKIIQWLGSLRGYVTAGSALFEQPHYVAEIVRRS